VKPKKVTPTPYVKPFVNEHYQIDPYPCINNPYKLNKHPMVDNVLKFNLTKGLGERHDFTQSNGRLKL
jgi:hypothetical protein